MSGGGARPAMDQHIPARPPKVARMTNVYASDGRTPGTASYQASEPPSPASRPMSGQLDTSLVPRLLQGLAGHVPADQAALELPTDGDSTLVRAIQARLGNFRLETAANTSLEGLRLDCELLARRRFENGTLELNSADVVSVHGTQGDATFFIETTANNGTINLSPIQIAIEAKAPYVFLKHFSGLGPALVQLDATAEATGIEGIMIKMAVHLHSVGGRFGLWWCGPFFAFAELVHLPGGGTRLLVSPIMSTFNPAFPLPRFQPPILRIPAPGHLFGCMLAVIGHALGHVQIPPSTLAPAPSASGHAASSSRETARATTSTTTSPRPGPRQMPEGARAVSLGCSNGIFDVRALVRPANATVEYSNADLYDVQPRPLTSVRFSVVRQLHGPSALPIQIDQLTDAFLSARPDDREDPDFCPMDQVPDCPPSVRIILHNEIGRGRTSIVRRAEAIAIDTGEPIADVSLVAKLVTHEHFFSAAREELFYTEVLPKCPVDVQNLLPRYYGAFMRAAGSWVGMLFEDAGSPISPVDDDWCDEDLQDDSEECRQAHTAFDKLRKAGIEHGDRRHPNVGVRDGRVRVFDLGQARLKAPE